MIRRKNRRFIFFLLIPFFFFNPINAKNPPLTSKAQSGTLLFGGLHRTFVYYLPAKLSPTQGKAALVLVLHGALGTGSGMQILTFNRFNELADRDGFIALYPDGVGKVWNDGRKIQGEMAHREKIDDLGFLSALIDQFENQFGADPRRVYVTGISNGAMMSTRLACELSEKIAAAAPVAGSIPQVLMGACHSKFPVSMLFINGDEDPLVPFKGGQVRAFGQDRGEIIPVEEAARFWAQRDGCPPKPKEELLPNQAPEDGTTVKKISYAPGPSGDEVILYVIQGGGHTWPKGWKYAGEWLVGRVSHQLEACDVIWEFFKNHPKNKKSKAEG